MSISPMSNNPPATTPAPAAPVRAAPERQPVSAEKPDIAVPKVDLAPIPKADLKVDVDQLKQQLQEAIKQMKEAVNDGGRGLNISVDPAVGGPVVVVKNVSTGEVIRQIPNEDVVRTARNIEKFRSLFINKLV